MDQSLVVLLLLALVGLVMIGFIILNSRKPRLIDEQLSDYERCTIKFTHAGLFRFGSSFPGHIGINENGVVVKLLTTEIIPYSDIRSVSIRNGWFSTYLRIAYGIAGQDVRIYSKQPDRLLADIKDRADKRATI